MGNNMRNGPWKLRQQEFCWAPQDRVRLYWQRLNAGILPLLSKKVSRLLSFTVFLGCLIVMDHWFNIVSRFDTLAFVHFRLFLESWRDYVEVNH